MFQALDPLRRTDEACGAAHIDLAFLRYSLRAAAAKFLGAMSGKYIGRAFLLARQILDDPELTALFDGPPEAVLPTLRQTHRFKRFDDLVPAAIGAAIAALPPERFIAIYEAARGQTAAGKRTAAKGRTTRRR